MNTRFPSPFLAFLILFAPGASAIAGCSATEESPVEPIGRTAQAVSQAVKDASSFNYVAVTPITAAPIPGSSKGFAGSGIVYADVTGDGKNDLIAVTSIDTVTTYVGNGNGTFTKGPETKLPTAPAGKIYVGYGIVANGDFDGDGKADIALVSTTAYSQYPNGSWFGRFAFLYGGATGALGSMVQTADVMTSGEGTAFHIARDFDGDGKVDFFYGNYGYQSVMFSNPGRTFSAAVSVGTGNPGGISSPIGMNALFFHSGTTSKKVTWSSNRTKNTETLQRPSVASDVFDDFDGDGKLDIAGKYSSTPNTLQFGTVDTTSTKSELYGLTGYVSLLMAADLVGDGKKELLYNNDDYVYAVCGYTPGTTEVVASSVGIEVPYGTTLVNAGDLNGDKKTDFITMKNGQPAAAYLSGPKLAQPLPLTTLTSTPPSTSTPATPGTDAGATKPKKDAGTTKPGTTPEQEEETTEETADPTTPEATPAPAFATPTSGCAQAPAPANASGAAAFSLIVIALVARLRRRAQG